MPGGDLCASRPFPTLAQPFFVAVPKVGSTSGAIFRLEDKNNDGDAQDPGEATIFRDLKSASSIAVSQIFDLDQNQLRDVVYVMDPRHQLTSRLQDKDGDAEGADEICLFHKSTPDKPLTSQRMTTDATGKVLAVDRNRRSVIRVFDYNEDCSILPPAPRTDCPVGVLSDEYHVVKDKSGVDPDLFRPFGIAVTNDVMFVSLCGRSETWDDLEVSGYQR